MTETRFYHVNQRGKLVRQATWGKAQAAAKRGGYAWLDFCEPSREDLMPLAKPFGLHPLAIEDCTDANQLPKIDNYRRNTFLLFNAFDYSEHTLAIFEWDVFIGADFLITVHHRDAHGHPLLADVDRLAELHKDSVRQGPAFLLHLILDHVVDRKFVEIEELEEDMIQAEEAVLADPAHFNPAPLLHLRRDLLSIRKSLYYEREILVKVSRRDCPYIAENALYLYRDVYDHLSKFFELTESFRDVVTSLMEMYLSMLNNQMALASNAMNATVRRLTFITTIFMPLTLLASIGGMSEFTMMTGQQNWKIAYPLFVLGMIILGVASYSVLKWLERRSKQKDWAEGR